MEPEMVWELRESERVEEFGAGEHIHAEEGEGEAATTERRVAALV